MSLQIEENFEHPNGDKIIQHVVSYSVPWRGGTYIYIYIVYPGAGQLSWYADYISS